MGAVWGFLAIAAVVVGAVSGFLGIWLARRPRIAIGCLISAGVVFLIVLPLLMGVEAGIFVGFFTAVGFAISLGMRLLVRSPNW